MKNYCMKLAKRPGVNGVPEEDNFCHEECEYPVIADDGDLIMQVLYLSVDPAQRCQMNEDTGADYLEPYEINKVIRGLFGVGKVVESLCSDFKPGDIVIMSSSVGGWPWQLYFKVSEGKKKLIIVNQLEDPKYEITYYGISGLTALIGLQEKGYVTDGNGCGKAFVVSGAAGSCGHLAGQFALAYGCNPVVGICGSDEKCKILIDQLNFSGAVNYKSENVRDMIKTLCPNGVDVYFDNVGGDISDAVIANMNENSHIILCGQISKYNSDVPYPPPLEKESAVIAQEKNITRERYTLVRYLDKVMKAREDLYKLKLNGKVKVLETVYDGLENVGKAFCDMMKGKNIGKQLVKVSD